MHRVAVPLDLTREATRPRGGRAVRLSGPTMGVNWSLQALAPPDISDAAIRDTVQSACDTVVAQMSTWEPESLISRYNRAEAGCWMALPPEMEAVVAAALEVSRLSRGAFDPSVGEAVDAWGFGPSAPSERAPEPTVQRPGVALQDGLLLQPGRVRLDLSGIAKGFGVDFAADALERLGLRDYLLEIGGELRGGGVKADGEPWWVEIEAPPGIVQSEAPILAALHRLSIATSGDWRRTVELEGRRYSHTIDPATGRPVENGIRAVSVLHAECMWADAFCTALTVLGDAAPAFASQHQLAAHIVWQDREWVSPRLQLMLD